VFKRMGFLADAMPEQKALADACRARMTQGVAKLDPSMKSPRLVRAWRLWIPETWAQARRSGKARQS
jgi:hypothetical protein